SGTWRRGSYRPSSRFVPESSRFPVPTLLERVAQLIGNRTPLKDQAFERERREEQRRQHAPRPPRACECYEGLAGRETDERRHEERLVAVAEHVGDLGAQEQQEQVRREPRQDEWTGTMRAAGQRPDQAG